MKEIAESPHWKQTERLPGGAAAVVSIDVRQVLLAADWRRRHPTFVDKLQARITRPWRRKKKA